MYLSRKSITDYNIDFSNFKAFKTQKVYNNIKRLNSEQGNDFWESGITRPDLVLKDLIKIFHPDLIDHELFYYQRLE